MAAGVPTRLTAAEGRRFGLTVGVAFLGLSALLLWREHTYGACVTAVLGSLLILGGLALPSRLGPVQRVWMGIASLISKVTTPVFMGIVYFIAVTPTGLLMRLLGRNPIGRHPSQTTFWVTRPPGGRRSDIERQF